MKNINDILAKNKQPTNDKTENTERLEHNETDIEKEEHKKEN